MPTPHDVVIVGAGPAGLGVAAALSRLDIRATIVDRTAIGASFRRWPQGTRLLTPSFTGNLFGAVDLNAITPDTSPALTLVEEHPTGDAYADYLETVAKVHELAVDTGVDVLDVAPARNEQGEPVLRVVTRDAPDLHARSVVWAAGEAAYPRTGGFPGAEHGRHTMEIGRFADHPGDHVVIVGGYESGIDAACHLVADGRHVTVLDPAAPWEVVDADPSHALAPVTHERLRRAHATGRVTLIGDAAVERLTRDDDAVTVHAEDGRTWRSDGPPLLATGFVGSLTVLRDRFAFDDAGRVVVTEEADESTVVPRLHLAGPALAHRQQIFCFIYKFRQRFAIVAGAIAADLGVDPAPLLAEHADHHVLLDDLSCCDRACAC